jgi:1-acyl-sn-glycerol-3-phosphate acyltransferase
MLRTITIYVVTIVSTVILAAITLIVTLFSRTGNIQHRIARFWARLILFVSGIGVTVSGTENIAPGRSVIYMANHQSNFDIPVLLAKLPVQFRWVAKAELFKIPLFGWAMRGCGYISIDRADRQSAFQSLAEAAETIRKGTAVMVFPEGTRSPDGRIKPFKKGPFVLAVDAGVPVVPIVIHGTWFIMPRDRHRIRPCRVTLHVLPAVETVGYSRDTKADLMQTIGSRMRRHFAEMKGDPGCN